MFVVKQLIKMVLQHIILPVIYGFWQIVYSGREPELIVFADAHHDTFPYSMKNMYEEMQRRGHNIITEIHDYSKLSQPQTVLLAARFMKIYAQAKVIFICDNFFPVVSCKKSKKTKVVQLWHSCGLLKKMGYDTEDTQHPSQSGRLRGHR